MKKFPQFQFDHSIHLILNTFHTRYNSPKSYWNPMRLWDKYESRHIPELNRIAEESAKISNSLLRRRSELILDGSKTEIKETENVTAIKDRRNSFLWIEKRYPNGVHTMNAINRETGDQLYLRASDRIAWLTSASGRRKYIIINCGPLSRIATMIATSWFNRKIILEYGAHEIQEIFNKAE